MAVDRTSPIPLWAQIESDLRSRLATGEFDERFPTEPELIETYQVSRPTVRQAIATLEQDGLVVRRRGDGTRAADRHLAEPATGVYSLAGWITSTGLEERSVVDVCALETATESAARALAIPTGTPAVHIVRIRYAGEEPLAVVRSWVPEAVGLGLLDVDLTTGSLYEHLHRLSSIRPTGSEERMRPVDPDPADRRLLQLPDGCLALALERRVYAGATPIEHREAVIRGDRYELTSVWGSVPATG